ncbi:MAG: hypothetical protein IJ251_02685 [Oscillospiraceae bacterium]|nr:hypothetical protein [Oscillospiraceae bacterium]
MSLKNRSKDMTPFDMARRPVKQNPFLMPLVWGVCYVMTKMQGLDRVRRIGMDGLKPPFLVIASHQGFSDYYIAPRALFPHRASYISDMEGFAAFGNELYRQIGCIGKRRYTADLSVVRNVRYALDVLGQPVVIFPESRHCDAGVTSTLPDNLGKLIKHLGVPVAVLTANGSYLANPFWDEERTRRTKLSADIEAVFTSDDVERLPEDEIQRIIADKLRYDEYAYQWENRISIKDRPAQGLHLPLYKCRKCLCEGQMQGSGDILRCRACGAKWVMDEYGRLSADGEYIHIPDWYRWERKMAEEEASEGYDISFAVRVEALPNEKGFVPLGTGTLRHNAEGFELSLDKEYDGLADVFPLRIPSKALPSVQTEYNYRGRGKCVVLSSKNCCYYCYSDDPRFIVTKLEFIGEYFYSLSHGDAIHIK